MSKLEKSKTEEVYSSVFVFDDWYLYKPIGTIAQQYDHLSRTLLVVGDLPEGYIWHILIQKGENLNIVLMEPVEDESGIALAVSEELSNGEPSNVKMIGAIIERGYVHEAGKYSIQLRGTKDDEVRHTNLVSVRIPRSLSGDEQWPEVPSEFAQIEDRINGIYKDVQKVSEEAVNAKNAIENLSATVTMVSSDKKASVEKNIDEGGNISLDFSLPSGDSSTSTDIILKNLVGTF